MNSNRYAKLVVALFLIVAALAVGRFVLLSRVPYSYMDGEFPWWMQQKAYVHTKGDKSEVIFLGDSRMKAGIIPEKVCDNAYNLAVGGGTTVEMYYSLKDYLKFHAKPKMVVMGFAPVHYVAKQGVTINGTYKNRTLYFHFLSPFQEMRVIYTAAKTGQLKLKDVRSEISATLKYTLLFPEKYSAACINSKFGRNDLNRARYTKNATDKGHMYFGVRESDDGLNSEVKTKQFTIFSQFDFYLREIIALCQKENIPLFIEQLPMNTPSWNKINESGYYAQYKRYLEKISQEINVPIETAVPCYEPECFGDSSHLNARGAKRFSAEIKAKYGL